MSADWSRAEDGHAALVGQQREAMAGLRAGLMTVPPRRASRTSLTVCACSINPPSKPAMRRVWSLSASCR